APTTPSVSLPSPGSGGRCSLCPPPPAATWHMCSSVSCQMRALISGSVLLLTRFAVVVNIRPSAEYEREQCNLHAAQGAAFSIALLDLTTVQRDRQLHFLFVGRLDDHFEMVARLFLVLDHQDFPDFLDRAARLF